MRTIALLLLFAVWLASAHLEGESVAENGYRIELSTLPETIEVGKNADIIIFIENATTGTRLPGVSVWMRLSKDDRSVFSSSNLVTDQFGSASVGYVFQESGIYDAKISLRDYEADGTFDVTVHEGTRLYIYAAVAIALLLAGFASAKL